MSIHQLQSWPDSCIAAAMCMIQRWRDEAPTEARFHQANDWLRPHFIATLPRVEARLVERNEEEDQVVVATAMAQNYESWRATAYPDIRSPHGTMTALYHMVVLISATHDGYRLLDPFYPSDGQPLDVLDDDFVGWFTGLAFIASR